VSRTSDRNVDLQALEQVLMTFGDVKDFEIVDASKDEARVGDQVGPLYIDSPASLLNATSTGVSC
jgi:hypothetical protein